MVHEVHITCGGGGGATHIIRIRTHDVKIVESSPIQAMRYFFPFINFPAMMPCQGQKFFSLLKFLFRVGSRVNIYSLWLSRTFTMRRQNGRQPIAFSPHQWAPLARDARANARVNKPIWGSTVSALNERLWTV